MVEQLPVKQWVVGSNPTSGALRQSSVHAVKEIANSS